MPTPKKTTGSGTKAFVSGDGSTYKEFASLTKLSPPSMSRGTVDVTDLNSFENNDQFKEFMGDFIEADEMNLEGFFVESDEGRTAFETAFYAGTPCLIKVQLPSVIGKDMIVKGVPTKYQPLGEISPGSGIAFSASIKPTAKPTLQKTGGQ